MVDLARIAVRTRTVGVFKVIGHRACCSHRFRDGVLISLSFRLRQKIFGSFADKLPEGLKRTGFPREATVKNHAVFVEKKDILGNRLQERADDLLLRLRAKKNGANCGEILQCSLNNPKLFVRIYRGDDPNVDGIAARIHDGLICCKRIGDFSVFFLQRAEETNTRVREAPQEIFISDRLLALESENFTRGLGEHTLFCRGDNGKAPHSRNSRDMRNEVGPREEASQLGNRRRNGMV